MEEGRGGERRGAEGGGAEKDKGGWSSRRAGRRREKWGRGRELGLRGIEEEEQLRTAGLRSGPMSRCERAAMHYLYVVLRKVLQE